MRFYSSSAWPSLVNRLASSIPASPHARKVVLLADDNQATLLTATRILEQCGCVLLRVTRPQEAVELFERFGDTIDMLITDLSTLEKSEDDLAEGLRQWSPSLPVLFVSEASRVDSSQDNCCFMEKPFTVWGLIESVASALEAPDLIKRAHLQFVH